MPAECMILSTSSWSARSSSSPGGTVKGELSAKISHPNSSPIPELSKVCTLSTLYICWPVFGVGISWVSEWKVSGARWCSSCLSSRRRRGAARLPLEMSLSRTQFIFSHHNPLGMRDGPMARIRYSTNADENASST